MSSRIRRGTLAAAACLAVAAPAALAADPTNTTLVQRAVLPAATFAPGPPSGAFIGTTPINGVTPPFASQPVQGFSAVLPDGNGSYLIMEDNGYGAKANSSDFLLRVYHVTPHFEDASGGPGTVDVGAFIQLRDPDHRIPFHIVNDGTADRVLTGADFDIESIRRGSGRHASGSATSSARSCSTPTRPAGCSRPRSRCPACSRPDNPTSAPRTPTLGSSKGFEGMARGTGGRYLYPMLEGALTADPDQSRRFIYQFDTRTGSYTGTVYQYRMEDPGYSIGDFTAARQQPLPDHRARPEPGRDREAQADLPGRPARRRPGRLAGQDEVVDLMHMNDPQPALPARPAGRHRARQRLHVPVPDDRGRAADRQEPPARRERQQLPVQQRAATRGCRTMTSSSSFRCRASRAPDAYRLAGGGQRRPPAVARRNLHYRFRRGERTAPPARAGDRREHRRGGGGHGRDRPARAGRPGAQPRRPLRLRRAADRGGLWGCATPCRLGGEHAGVQLVLPAADAHVHPPEGENWFALAVYLGTGDRGQRARGACAPARAAAAEQRERESALLAALGHRAPARRGLDEELDEVASRAAEALGVDEAEIELGQTPPAARRLRRRIHSRSPAAPSARSTPPRMPSRTCRCDCASCRRWRRCSPWRRSRTARAGGRGGRAAAPDRPGQDRAPARRVPRPALAADRHQHRDRCAAQRQRHPERGRAGRAARDDRPRRGPPRPAGRRPARPVPAGGRRRGARRARSGRSTTSCGTPSPRCGARERVEVAGEAPLVDVDAGQIQRVLANLIDNALKFSPPGRPGARAHRLDAQGGHRAGRRPGPGARRGQLERVFEPFYRGRDAERAGAGLGLAIARGFAEANGGRVWAESRPGQGASFALALPVVEVPVGLHGQLTGQRVLVVDDEPQILRALRTTLRGAGYDVETARPPRARWRRPRRSRRRR